MMFSEKKFDYELFKNPTAEYRGLPFWSWNCKISREKIDEQLKIFKEMGFGGVVIHPRDGLDTPYLSDEYMDMVKYAVGECRKAGLICWLYDDDRFPSGAADGFVTRNPKFRARCLKLTATKSDGVYCESKEEFEDLTQNGEIPKGYFVCAYRIKTVNGKITRYQRINDRNESIGNDEKIRYAYVELQEESEWFQGHTYVDTMNPCAVDEFINVTHKRYKSVLGKDFGTAASAVFTDEPRIGKQQPLLFAESNEDVFVPYTDYFADKFKEKYGFDALDIIPEYIWDRADGNMRGRYIYRATANECFSEAFMDRICSWCRDNGILMTGHILGEENLMSQTSTVADAMRTYKNMDIPGIDILTDSREFSSVKQAASVAAQYGRTGVMSEMYGVTNWDCTFKTYKLQGDWQAALGINIRVPHLSHMSLLGEAKRDWPASIFYQSPWYKKYPYIENHFARLNTVLTRGKRVTKIGVIHPVESMWIKYACRDLNGETQKVLETNFNNITQWLLCNTLDFDYISESLLTEQYMRLDDARFNVGKMSYDTVIVPNMITIRNTTLDALEEFAENGGNIIFMGNIPQYVCGTYSERALKLAQKCINIPNNKAPLLDCLEYLRDVKITDLNGVCTEKLLYHLRDDNDCKWLFISHTNKSNSLAEENYIVKIKGDYSAEFYDTITGDKYDMQSYTENGYTVLRWDCYSEDSILLRFCKPGTENSVCKTAEKYENTKKYKTVCRIEEITDFKCSEPNVLLLDYAGFGIDGGKMRKKDEILRVDNKVRRYLGFTERTGADRQPWATEITENHTVMLNYEFYSEKEMCVRLALENPQNSVIRLNGEKADTAVVGWYVDKDIKVINLPKIRNGRNKLEVELVYNQKTMLENMYLLGDFGVRFDGVKPVITEKCTKLVFSDITKQGMAFYTGNIEYIFNFDAYEKDEYFIKIPEFAAPVVEVYADGMEKGVIAYAPHRASLGVLDRGTHEIKIVLYGSRFNGFGMLHNANKNYVWYGNGSYRTTGEEWTDDYMLRKVGIMSGAEIERMV